MASAVDICNDALAMLGHAPGISALDQGGTTAGLCARFYPASRDELLRGHRWNFATKRAELAASTTAPTWGYDSSYPLPTDCLRVLGIEGHELLPWRVEGRALVCNESSPLNLIYIARIDDPALFDPAFARALAARIAVDLSMPITNNQTMRQAMQQEFKDRLREARGIDAQEASVEVPYADAFIDARW